MERISTPWRDDTELFAMDKPRVSHPFLPGEIQPLDRSMILIGRAMLDLESGYFTESSAGFCNPVSSHSFGLMFGASDLQPGGVRLD